MVEKGHVGFRETFVYAGSLGTISISADKGCSPSMGVRGTPL